MNTIQNYQPDPFKDMDHVVDREQRKLMKWQQLKANQESTFRQDLDRFKVEIERRRSRLQRIMGGDLLKREKFQGKMKGFSDKRLQALERFKGEEIKA